MPDSSPTPASHDAWIASLALVDLALPTLSGGQPQPIDAWIAAAAWSLLWAFTRHRWSSPRARALLAAALTSALWGTTGLSELHAWASGWIVAPLLVAAALALPTAAAWLLLPLGVHLSALAWPNLPAALPWLVDLTVLGAFALRSRRIGLWIPWVAAALLAAPRPTAGGHPNILLITVDCLRTDAWPADAFDDLGGQHGVAVAPAPWTLGSLGSMFTAVDPDRHGGSRDGNGFTAVDPQHLRLAEHLAASGYRTAAHSAGNVFTGSTYGLLQGFQRISHPWFAAGHGLPLPRTSHGRSVSTAARWPRLVRSAPRASGDLLDTALSSLRRPAGSTFAWVHLMDLHLPYAQASCAPDTLTRGRTREAMLADPWWSTPEGHACFRQAYMDVAADLLVQVRSAIAAAPEGTLVLLTADHGESLGEDGLEHGHTLHPSVTVVPWWWFGTSQVPPSGRSLQDLGATLTDALDLPPFPGTSWHTQPAPTRPVSNMLYGAPRHATLRDGILTPDDPPGPPTAVAPDAGHSRASRHPIEPR